MKITYFVNQYPKVSHTFIRREILALEGLGFDIQRIALRGWNEELPDLVDQRERDKTRYVLRGGALALFLPTLSFALRSPISLMRAFRIAIRMSFDTDRRIFHHLVCVMEGCVALRWVRRHASTHVHAHFGTNSTEVAMHMRILGGPPFSFTAHGPREFIAPLAIDEKLRHAKFAVAISSFGRSQLYMRAAYADWGKIHVVRCGIEKGFYENALVAQNTSRTFLCIGRLSEAKGQMLLLAAVARLIERGIDLHLTIAGDGPMRSVLDEFIVKHELSSRVRITGWISSAQVRSEILGSRALVLPSFAEGLPVVLMEAMFLRKPVLTTYVAGIPELVQHNVSGWLFPAGSSSEIEAAMEACLSCSENTLDSMGRQGFERVSVYHSAETEAAKLAALIQSQ